MQTAHDRANGDLEHIGGLLIGKIAEVDQHHDLAERQRQLGQRVQDRTGRESLDQDINIGDRVATETLVEVVVVGLEPQLLGCSLLLARIVNREVVQDAQQPRAQIRAGLVRAPRTEGAGVGLLDKILGGLVVPCQAASDTPDIVGKRERLFVEGESCRIDRWIELVGSVIGHTPRVPVSRARIEGRYEGWAIHTIQNAVTVDRIPSLKRY